MTKRSIRKLTKKGLLGLTRGKSKNGELNSRGFNRWWFYKGQQYETLREVVTRYGIDQLHFN